VRHCPTSCISAAGEAVVRWLRVASARKKGNIDPQTELVLEVITVMKR
jgi:hypothetical protein